MTFKPERFLGTDNTLEPDPHMYVFGFGRRICPGRILADNALYLTIAQALAVFRIGKAKTVRLTPNGAKEEIVEIEPEVKFQPGVVSHPVPYKTTIEPRSAHHEALIRNIENVYPWQESDAKTLKSMSY